MSSEHDFRLKQILGRKYRCETLLKIEERVSRQLLEDIDLSEGNSNGRSD